MNIRTVSLSLVLAGAAAAEPTQWGTYTGCKNDLDLEDVGRSYQYRLFAEGGASDGTFTGITTVPEWLPILVALDRATDGRGHSERRTPRKLQLEFKVYK